MSFSWNFHNGDRFVKNCVFYYKGGHERVVKDTDLDKWSFFEAIGILNAISDLDYLKYRL